jgi:hypothetical protein
MFAVRIDRQNEQNWRSSTQTKYYVISTIESVPGNDVISFGSVFLGICFPSYTTFTSQHIPRAKLICIERIILECKDVPVIK